MVALPHSLLQRRAQEKVSFLVWVHLSEPGWSQNHTTYPFLSRSSHFIFFHLSRWQNIQVVVVQSLSRVQLFATPWTAACQAPLSSTIFQSCSDTCTLSQWCYLTSYPLPSLLLVPSIFFSIRIFSNESAFDIRWPEYWSFSFSVSLSNGYSGLISFGIDWFDLFAVQGTLKNLLQHHSLKISLRILASIFDLELNLKKKKWIF